MSSEQKGTSQQSGGEEADFLLVLSLSSCCPACNNRPRSAETQQPAQRGQQWGDLRTREKAGQGNRHQGQEAGQPPPLRPRAAVCTDRKVLPGQTGDGWAQRLSGLMYKQLLVFVCFSFHLSWNEQVQLSGDFC